MDLALKDKVAIVTGGSRGIGRAICLSLAAEGCNVALCARGEDELRQAERDIAARGVQALGIVADLSDPETPQRLVDEVVGRFGRVDILVNNAGGARHVDEDAAWRDALELNLMASVRMTRAVTPHMRQLGAGSIIHIASIYGRESSGGSPVYNAAKAAMISHAKMLALELAPEGIRINSVAPGSIQHPGGSWDRRVQADPEGMKRFIEQNIPSGRFGSAPEVADVVTFLASPRSGWITGASINVDGGQSRSTI